MIKKQVLAFGKSEKSEFINIGIFAASLGGLKRETPYQEIYTRSGEITCME